MADAGDASDDWSPSGRESGRDQLQRSINHVENLLHRLELGTPPPAQDAGAGRAAATGDGGASAEDQPMAVDASPDGARNQQSGAEPADPMTQAEAMRVTLTAHEEAGRIRADAEQLHAQAAAEGEELLAKAKWLCEQMQEDAWTQAQQLRHQAEQTVADAQAEADRVTRAAIADAAAAAKSLRVAACEEAEGILQDARDWAAQQRADAETAAHQRVEGAERDTERIRATAREMAQVEAERRIEIEVHSAIASARADAEATRQRAEQMLSAAIQNLAAASTCLADLTSAVQSGLASIAATSGSLDSMLGQAKAEGRVTPAKSNGSAPKTRGGKSRSPAKGPDAAVLSAPDAVNGESEVGDRANGDRANGERAVGEPGERSRRPLGALFRNDRQ